MSHDTNPSDTFNPSRTYAFTLEQHLLQDIPFSSTVRGQVIRAHNSLVDYLRRLAEYVAPEQRRRKQRGRRGHGSGEIGVFVVW